MSEALVTISENRFLGSSRYFADRDGIVKEICDRLQRGEPLAAICREEGMPTPVAVSHWAQADMDVATAIAQSRAIGEEAIALQAQEIIDGLHPVPGVPADATRDKARAEVRLKLLAKFNPKRWGDSTQLRHADADGGKLDNSPLIAELLALMPGGSPAAQPLIEARARNVTPTPARRDTVDVTPAPAKPAYKPRIRPATDVDDLV